MTRAAMVVDPHPDGRVAYMAGRFAPILLGGAGALYLALIAWFAVSAQDEPFFGVHIYDEYYKALLEGRVDLPPRLLRFEGHYLPDATGYLYHGAAPLLTRFALGWIWPFDTVAMSGVSVWFWAVIGTVFYQVALFDIARRSGVLDTPAGRNWIFVLGGALWLAGPALLLVVNQSLFHEPIAVAFAAAGGFVAVWMRMALGQLSFGKAVILLALCAAVSVHARPNIAIGLYAGVVIAAAWGLWRYRAQFLLPGMAASAIIMAGGLGYLGLNAARFDDAARTHGSFEEGSVRYGSVFWGNEDPDSSRARAFIEHGRFNIRRILPNAAMYSFYISTPADVLLGLYRKVTEPVLGMIRIENPNLGVVFLWPAWCMMGLLGVLALRGLPGMTGLAAALAIGAGVTLSYGTITLRYRIDLWPIIGALAIVGATSLLPRLTSQSRVSILQAAFGLLLMVGVVFTLLIADGYHLFFRERTETFFAPWSYDFCAQRAATAGLPAEDTPIICRPPRENDT